MKPHHFKTFDVRTLLARGEENFAAFCARVNNLAAGQGVTGVAPFMPTPLIDPLKSEGFTSSHECVDFLQE
jgi:hypothetical protein